MIPRIPAHSLAPLTTSGRTDDPAGESTAAHSFALDVLASGPSSSVLGRTSAAQTLGSNLTPPTEGESSRSVAPRVIPTLEMNSAEQLAVDQCIEDCKKIRDAGDCDKAISIIDDVLQRENLTTQQMATLLMHKGRNYQQLSDFAKAVTSYQQADQAFADVSLTCRSRSSFQIGMAKLLWSRSYAVDAPKQAEVRRAFERASAALEEEQRLPSLPTKRIAEIMHNQAFLLEQQGAPKQAAQKYTELLKFRKAAADTRGQAYTCHRLAICYRTIGELGDALRSIDSAIELYERCGVTGQSRVVEARAIATQLRLEQK